MSASGSRNVWLTTAKLCQAIGNAAGIVTQETRELRTEIQGPGCVDGRRGHWQL